MPEMLARGCSRANAGLHPAAQATRNAPERCKGARRSLTGGPGTRLRLLKLGAGAQHGRLQLADRGLHARARRRCHAPHVLLRHLAQSPAGGRFVSLRTLMRGLAQGPGAASCRLRITVCPRAPVAAAMHQRSHAGGLRQSSTGPDADYARTSKHACDPDASFSCQQGSHRSMQTANTLRPTMQT